jgi:hypothetical protein
MSHNGREIPECQVEAHSKERHVREVGPAGFEPATKAL